MKMFRTKAIAALVVPAVVAIGAASALPASAAIRGAGQPCPVITDVRTVAAFDYAVGQEPESVNITPDGSLLVSMLGFLVGKPPELIRISPSGQQTILVTGPVGDAIGGNALGRDGTIYYNVVSPDPSRSGVWRLPPHGTPQRIAAMPAGQFLNGLTLDSSNQTLYVADSLASTIWAIPTSGGPAKAWLVSPALAPSTSAHDIGANGIEYHNGAVWISDTDQGTLLRVPVTASGAPGPIQVIASNLAGIDDFKFLSERSDVAFVALNFQDKLAVVYPDGRTRIVLDASSGLDSPTNTVISGTRIYITNSGLAAPNDASLQVGKINIRALFENHQNQVTSAHRVRPYRRAGSLVVVRLHANGSQEVGIMNSPVAVVIGAGALGRATAAILAGSGLTVVAVDRTQDALRELPGSIRSEVADTTDPATATPLVDRLAREIGPPAVLVNTIGAFRQGDALSTTPETLQLMIDVNLGPALWMTQAVAPHMAQLGSGAIVHVAARPAIEASGGTAAYSVSKAALVHLTRILDVELRPRGIRVNAVAPQLLDTAANRAAFPAEVMAHAVAPEAIAAVIAFLVSDAAAPVSGAILPAYGA